MGVTGFRGKPRIQSDCVNLEKREKVHLSRNSRRRGNEMRFRIEGMSVEVDL